MFLILGGQTLQNILRRLALAEHKIKVQAIFIQNLVQCFDPISLPGSFKLIAFSFCYLRTAT